MKMTYITLMGTKIRLNQRRTLKDLGQAEVGPVGFFIRQRRKHLGYTQEEFASRVGVGLRFLKDIELGKKTARMDTVNKVLEFLGHQLIPAPLPKTEAES